MADAGLTVIARAAGLACAVSLLVAPVRRAEAAAPPSVAYWDNWTDAAGLSHLTRCLLRRFSLRSASGPATPEWEDRQTAPAGAVLVHVEQPGWNGGWHENPKVQWIMPLAGSWLVQAMDGSQVTIRPGDVMAGEDQNSRPDAAGHAGHLSRNVGTVPVVLMIVQMAELPRSNRPCRFD